MKSSKSIKTKILVFTEGTVLMHSSLKSLDRKQRVARSKSWERPLPPRFFASEIPNGEAVKKLETWKKQGAQIFYLTSRTEAVQINDIREVLNKYKFPDHENFLFRKAGEEYKDVAERLQPDILIEDDCESIGGEKEMTYPHIRANIKRNIKSIVVIEFGGIDHLPDDIKALRALKT